MKYGDLISHAHVVWHPDGQIQIVSVVQDRERDVLYATDSDGVWWRLSDPTSQGWRIPSVKISKSRWPEMERKRYALEKPPECNARGGA